MREKRLYIEINSYKCKEVKMVKKDINATGIALAFTFLIVSIICLLLVFIAPEFALNLFGSFVHGIDLTKIAVTPSISGNTLLGIILVTVSGYLIGVIFAVIYNKFARK